MIGAMVGLLVGQDDLLPGIPTSARVPRPNAGALATTAAIHALAFKRGDVEAALRDLRDTHPALGAMPGVSGLLRGGDDWILSVAPTAEEFVPWPIVVAWLCPTDWRERVVAMMSVAYPSPGDHLSSTLAATHAVRLVLDGMDPVAVSASLTDAYPDLKRGPVGEATAAGIEAGLTSDTFTKALLPFSEVELPYDRGTAAFVAGAVASARLDVPGWAYLACCDLTEDIVQGAMDVFDAMLADPRELAARAPVAVRPYNDLASVHDEPATQGPLGWLRRWIGEALSLARRRGRMTREGNR